MSASDTMGLWRVACRLSGHSPGPRTLGLVTGAGKPALPPLVFVTDPMRTPDPAAIVARLPAGCGVIYRSFGAADAREVARALRRIADRRGLRLLIGADADLAAGTGADGVHLPERRLHEAIALRAKQPGWLITGAAHGARALGQAARLGLDAALLSPAFESRSPSAGRALGPVRFAALVRAAGLPVYALGGVTVRTAPRLGSERVAGIAAVDGIAGPVSSPSRQTRACAGERIERASRAASSQVSSSRAR